MPLCEASTRCQMPQSVHVLPTMTVLIPNHAKFITTIKTWCTAIAVNAALACLVLLALQSAIAKVEFAPRPAIQRCSYVLIFAPLTSNAQRCCHGASRSLASRFAFDNNAVSSQLRSLLHCPIDFALGSSFAQRQSRG
jgi:hypothetical protein